MSSAEEVTMSSSDAASPRPWGTVYIGPNTVSVTALEDGRHHVWTEADETAYLERVRGKAAEKAAEILAEAGRQADELRRAAQEEGYAAGMAEAETELEQFRAAMADSVSGVLNAIEGQCSSIFQHWRAELISLLRLAVEKGVGLALAEDRAALLEALYTQSVAALENRRNLIIRAHPDDEPVIADIVALTQARYPDLKAWNVKADAAVAQGGLLVESEDSLVDNRAEKRMTLVNDVLANLTLPPGV